MSSQFYVGMVENRIGDPLRLGRMQVRVFGVHSENLTDIPTESLPWAMPLSSSNNGLIPSFTEGTLVFVFFQDGESKQSPIILGCLNGVPIQKSTYTVESVEPDTLHFAAVPVETNGEVVKEVTGNNPSAYVAGSTTTVPASTTTTPTINPVSTQTSSSTTSNNVSVTTVTPISKEVQIVPAAQVTASAAAAATGIETVYAKIKIALGFKESTNNYLAINQLGYLGKYQFGAAVLGDFGYLVKGTPQSILKRLYPPNSGSGEARKDMSYWMGKMGTTFAIVNADVYLKDNALQEKLMDRLLAANHKSLKAMNVITDASTAQEIGGYLCTAHLLGCGGARNMKKGITKKDGNGVTGEEYYKMGYAAVNGTIAGETVVPGKEPEITPTSAIADNPNREASTVQEIGEVAKTQPTVLAKEGFTDPGGVYPKNIKEQGTSRLARNQNISDTIVTEKEETITRNVRIANSKETWDQSPVPYNAIYPYNQVIETESGHVLELDDSPNNERIHIYHRTGTFLEIDRNGTEVSKIIGDKYEIIDRNGFVSIKGDCNITVEGSANVYVANDCNMEVGGNFVQNIGGDATITVGGKYNFHANGDVTAISAASLKISSEAPMSLSSYADMSISSKGDIGMAAGKRATLTANGDIILSAYSNFTLIGSIVSINPSSPLSTVPIQGAIFKKFVTERGINTPLPPLTLEPRSFEILAAVEDNNSVLTGADATVRDAALNSAGLIASNPMDPIESTTVVTPSASSSNAVVEAPKPQETGKVNINDYISKNYKLKDLTKGLPIKAQSGLTDAQLADNLTLVALNVLEPIKAKYPDMIITSGLRAMGSNPRSQHPLGQAVDMQFTTKKSSQYIDIAKDLVSLLVFDQLILEYRTNSKNSTAGNPVTWIHVSFVKTGNKKQFFTMNNDSVISKFGEFKLITV